MGFQIKSYLATVMDCRGTPTHRELVASKPLLAPDSLFCLITERSPK